MTEAAPMRRRTWKGLDTGALNTTLVDPDAPSVMEGKPDRQVTALAWVLFGLSVGGSMLSAWIWLWGALLR